MGLKKSGQLDMPLGRRQHHRADYLWTWLDRCAGQGPRAARRGLAPPSAACAPAGRWPAFSRCRWASTALRALAHGNTAGSLACAHVHERTHAHLRAPREASARAPAEAARKCFSCNRRRAARGHSLEHKAHQRTSGIHNGPMQVDVLSPPPFRTKSGTCTTAAKIWTLSLPWCGARNREDEANWPKGQRSCLVSANSSPAHAILPYSLISTTQMWDGLRLCINMV